MYQLGHLEGLFFFFYLSEVGIGLPLASKKENNDSCQALSIGAVASQSGPQSSAGPLLSRLQEGQLGNRLGDL